jgi:uncharacterized membrane protein
VPCLLLVLGGALWRWPTLHRPDYLLFASQHLSYSDVVAFYGGSIAPGHQFPYIQQPIEYPVLTGLILWLTGFVPSIEGYFLANIVLLGGCLLGCYAILAQMGPGTHLARFAMAPGLALYGVLNWDAPALLCLVAALWCCRRDSWTSAGILVAVGASAKLFPVFILPVLVASSLHASWRPDCRSGRFAVDRASLLSHSVVRLLSGFAGALIVINGPFAILNWDGWFNWVTKQSQRGINPDSIWAHIPMIPEQVSRSLMASLMVGAITWVALEVWRGGSREAGALLSLLIFLLCTRDFSPQYDLWTLPLLAMLACPIWAWSFFVTADVLYAVCVFHFYASYAAGQPGDALTRAEMFVGWSVWGRETALAVLAVWAWTRLRHESSRGTVPGQTPAAIEW